MIFCVCLYFPSYSTASLEWLMVEVVEKEEEVAVRQHQPSTRTPEVLVSGGGREAEDVVITERPGGGLTDQRIMWSLIE